MIPIMEKQPENMNFQNVQRLHLGQSIQNVPKKVLENFHNSYRRGKA
jgi:hypothetical protein